MSFHRVPTERPRVAKRFLTVRDIEDLAASGGGQIVHTPDLVITDAAREVANELNIAIVKPSAAHPAAALPAAPSAPEIRAIERASEHRVPGASSAQMPGQNSSGGQFKASVNSPPLVQELVRAIQSKWRPVKRRQRQLLA